VISGACLPMVPPCRRTESESGRGRNNYSTNFPNHACLRSILLSRSSTEESVRDGLPSAHPFELEKPITSGSNIRLLRPGTQQIAPFRPVVAAELRPSTSTARNPLNLVVVRISGRPACSDGDLKGAFFFFSFADGHLSSLRVHNLCPREVFENDLDGRCRAGAPRENFEKPRSAPFFSGNSVLSGSWFCLIPSTTVFLLAETALLSPKSSHDHALVWADER